MTVRRTTHSEAETVALATRLAGGLAAGDVVCLEGPLGSGKTCFVRGLATGLGLDHSEVCSPTFVIWKCYENDASLTLIHMDAFRLAGPEDLDSIGWEELLETPDAVIAVEWPSRISEALPARRIEVVLEHATESSRHITLDAPPQITTLWERAEARPCPTCKTAVETQSETFPFCSLRCRLVDLGRWIDEGYRIPSFDPPS